MQKYKKLTQGHETKTRFLDCRGNEESLRTSSIGMYTVLGRRQIVDAVPTDLKTYERKNQKYACPNAKLRPHQT